MDEENKDYPIHKLQQPKVKPTGAFRHTEYAKGFYKVSGAAGSLLDEVNSKRTSLGGQDYNAAGYSEAERTNVLENVKSRK